MGQHAPPPYNAFFVLLAVLGTLYYVVYIYVIYIYVVYIICIGAYNRVAVVYRTRYFVYNYFV